jgi:hypothetical protein
MFSTSVLAAAFHSHFPLYNIVSEQQERHNLFSQTTQVTRNHFTAHLICIMHGTARHSVLYTLLYASEETNL